MFLHGKKYRWFVGVLAAALLSSCSFHDLHQAQNIVKQADSLRVEGQMYSDSLTLAQACETLGKSSLLSIFNYQLSTDYAHACYHYGRLLREKDNPVAAMQAFLNATHTHSRDYFILGRVYSNIGDICHHADEFSLSYDMFKRSAEMFLRDGDSISYYDDLNRMAFELAEQGKKEEAYTLLRIIEGKFDGSDVWGTKAVACKKAEQYDSALYYSSLLLASGITESYILLVRAQAYSYLGEKDSAAYYARLIVERNPILEEQNNALYILTNDDQTKDIDDVRRTAADRADAQKLLEIRQSKLAQATQLLEQDLARKKDWRGWIITVLTIVCAIVSLIAIIWRKHKRQAQNQITAITNKHAGNILEAIKKHIDTADLNRTLHWKDYNAMKVEVDLYMGGLVSKLEEHHLNEVEIRFCILTLLDFRLKQIAETIHYGYPSGIKTLKKRISDKLKTSPLALKECLLYKL